MVFDEVGTGKTVSALYCIRDVIAEKKDTSKVLIVCPNNKKAEWQKDIKRQLGLYAHLVESRSLRNVYDGNLKALYFKKGEPLIFIEGQKKEEKNDSFDEWIPGSLKWDIVVIDEGHQCFDNYVNIRANRAVMLTATPIVINSQTKEGVLDISHIRKINDYIYLLRKITGNYEDNKVLYNLFTPDDRFTQLFREDLNINPKIRNIVFKHCERLANREMYLEVLADVKGGMTKLIYEQDDEYLLYGVFEKFKKDIENAGYIVGTKPDIDNSKYKLLSNYICEAGNDKSYIIFFNSKWPAEKIYKHLIGDYEVQKNNMVVALKFGNTIYKVWPNDNAVTASNIFDYLLEKIDAGKKVLFLTTGASGGTGLNLGKFDGIVNYELPFTCIELEQRFGRVDRMDVDSLQNKEMLFILNQDANPMLRYSTLKINKTCEYMPIRNTILFCPAVIDEIIKSIKNELKDCMLDDNDKMYFQYYYNLTKGLDENDKKLVSNLEMYIVKKHTVDGFDEDIEGISLECEQLLVSMQDNVNGIIKMHMIKRKLDILSQEIQNLSDLLGCTDEASCDVNIYEVVDEFEDEELKDKTYEEYMLNEEMDIIRSKDIMIKNNIQQVVKEIDVIKMHSLLEEKLSKITYAVNVQNATGVFYIKDKKYFRQTVSEYREICKL